MAIDKRVLKEIDTQQLGLIYANEVDLLNVALFGKS